MKTKLTILVFYFISMMAYGNQGLNEAIRTTASDPNLPLRSILYQKALQEGHLDIELYVHGLDEEGILLQQLFIPLMKNLPGEVNFQLRYYAGESQVGTFGSIKSNEEVAEIRRQLAIEQLYPDRYLDYLLQRGDNYQSPDWQLAARRLGLDEALISAKARSEEISQLFQQHRRASLQSGFNTTEVARAQIFINEERMELAMSDLIPDDLTPLDCCSIEDCLLACLVDEFWGNGTKRILTVGLGILAIVACNTCIPKKGKIPKPNIPICGACLVSLLGSGAKDAALEFLKCLEDCLDDPCSGDSFKKCDEGSYCFKRNTVSIGLGVLNPPFLTCADCGEVEFTFEEIRLNSNLPPLVLGPPLNAVISETLVAFEYSLTINSNQRAFGIEENTIEFDWEVFQPRTGDKVCLSYEGLLAAGNCSDESCHIIRCPKVDLVVGENDQLTLFTNGLYDFMTLRYVLKKTVPGGQPETIKVGALFNQTDFEVVFNDLPPLQVGEKYTLGYSIEYNYNDNIVDCVNEVTIEIDDCDYEVNRVNFGYILVEGASVPGVNDGVINLLNVSGGQSPYTYQWSHDSNFSGSFADNLAGETTYCITVTDAVGCSGETCQVVSIDECINPNDGLNDGEGSNFGELNQSAFGGGGDGNGGPEPPTQFGCFSVELTPTDVSGPGATDGSISIAVENNTSQPPYHYYWSHIQGSTTLSDLNDLSPGEYCVTIYDENCCELQSCVTVGDACEQAEFDIPSPTIVQPTYCNSNNGSIGFLGGGNPFGPVYTYNWSNGHVGQFNSNLSPGQYSVTITNGENGCTEVNTYDLKARFPIEVSASTANPDFLTCNGSISLSITNGTPPFTIRMLNGTSTSIYSISSFTITLPGLCEGDYSFTVIDANLCEAYTSAELVACIIPLSIEDAAVIDATACDLGDGSIAFSDPGDFSFAWSNGDSGPEIDNLTPGNYIVTLTNDEGCTEERTYSVEQQSPNPGLSSFYELDFVVTPDEENNCAGSIYISVYYSGGQDILFSINGSGVNETFQMPTPLGQTTYEYTFDNLCAGDYEVTAVPNLASSEGCTITREVSIESCTNFGWRSTPEITRPPNCNSRQGSITFSTSPPAVGGGVEPYMWFWSDGSTTPNEATLLPVGMYTVTVVDAIGCMIEQTFDLSLVGDLNLVEITETVQPTNGCNGRITVQGIAGFQLTLSGPSPSTVIMNGSSYTFSNLCLGNYTLNVMDEFGCETNFSISLTQCAPISIGDPIIVHPASCSEQDGNIRFVNGPQGGAPPYTLTLFDAANTVVPFDGFDWDDLSEGTYRLLVVDANGCTLEANYTLLSVSTPQINGTLIVPECEDLENGAITLVVSIDLGPNDFEYALTKESTGATTVIQTDNIVDFEGLETGNYSMVITHLASGCTLEADYFVTEILSMGLFELDDPAYTVTKSCPYPDQESGTVTFNIKGGNKPYSVFLENGIGEISDDVPTAVTAVTIDRLPPGNYCTDYINDNCFREIPMTICFTIEAHPTFSLSSVPTTDCPGASSLNLTVSGGEGPFTYQWTGPNGFNSTAEDLSGLFEGEYRVMVTDVNGCTQEHSNNVDDFDSPDIDVDVEIPVACSNYPIGRISRGAATGGNPPYTYEWQGPNGFVSSAATISDLAPGIYRLFITDGCGTFSYRYTIADEDTYEISEPNSCFNQVWCGNNQVNLSYGGYVDILDGSDLGICAAEIICSNGQQIIVFGNEEFNRFEGGLNNGVCECNRVFKCIVNENYNDEVCFTNFNGNQICDNRIVNVLEESETSQSSPSDLETQDGSTGSGGCFPFEFPRRFSCGGIPLPECRICLDADTDGDGVIDRLDNCPDVYNPGIYQSTEPPFDCNNNSIMDWCEDGYLNEGTDSDGDRIHNNCDNCPNNFNPTQLDTDMDGVGDACESTNTGSQDVDNDGVPDDIDNCFNSTNAYQNAHQFDCDGDGIGDVCDPDYPCHPNAPATPISYGTNGNGNTMAGQVVVKTEDFNNANTVEVYPNPFDQLINLKVINTEAPHRLKLRLFNLLGQVVKQESLQVDPGTNVFTVEMGSDLPAGVYELSLQFENQEITTMKLVKTN